MSQESISGSCLCGSVRFGVTPPWTAFRYCHCSRCRKATGAAHAANLFLPETQFTWLAGEELIRHFKLPGAKRFSVSFCTQCGSRVPHKGAGANGDSYLIPAGLLEADPGARPDGSIFWGSRAPWFVETSALPKAEVYGK